MKITLQRTFPVADFGYSGADIHIRREVDLAAVPRKGDYVDGMRVRAVDFLSVDYGVTVYLDDDESTRPETGIDVAGAREQAARFVQWGWRILGD